MITTAAQPVPAIAPEPAPKGKRFALLLPVTSRGLDGRVADNVERLLHSLSATSLGAQQSAWSFGLFFGVDAGDPFLDPTSKNAVDLLQLADKVLGLDATSPHDVATSVTTFSYPPGHVCPRWRDLAAEAYGAGYYFFLLLGDDVVLLRAGWADDVFDEFTAIHHRTKLPFGFGCVALADESFPSFPTFPVVHRTHMQIFGGTIFPEVFLNQDADPFLFQIYRAFGAATLSTRARLTNTIGGEGQARYVKEPIAFWSAEPLTEARNRAIAWLGEHAEAPAQTISLDVVVPSYRVPELALRSILALPVPERVTTQFTIINDRPDDARALELIATLTREHRDDPYVRLRSNQANAGAGPSRNRGLRESAADWVLFLDDDVVPDEKILSAYASAIRKHPRATGFIGLSRLPPAQTARQAGVIMAGVAFFWHAASAFPSETELPWGVTANLCVRRIPGLAFDETGRFPKTGGGEDIDYCLRLREWMRTHVEDSEGFVAVPDAIIHHPWWDGGVPKYSHFSGWARGDGYLIDLYPQFTYRNWPNLAETVLGSTTAAMLLSAAYALSLLSPAAEPRLLTWAGLSLAACAACVAAELLVDAYIQLWEKPAPECQALPLRTRLGGIAQGLVIRTCSEVGRLWGHASRGNLLASMTRRFNWFGAMWPGAVEEERRQALRRLLARVVLVALLLFVLGW